MLSTVLIQDRLRTARVGRLATADALGTPHLIPVCFVYDDATIYTPIDGKPKSDWTRLARVKNIRARPAAALLVDEYHENWADLWYVLARGRATILERADDRERERALALLRQKYAQYDDTLLPHTAPVIRIDALQVRGWSSAEQVGAGG